MSKYYNNIGEGLFEVKEEHIKLLKNFCVSYDDYCEYGAPCIDPKRPYGNSDVEDDIVEIIGYKPNDVKELHRDMEIVLQILCNNLSIETGFYTTKNFGINWVKVG